MTTGVTVENKIEQISIYLNVLTDVHTFLLI